MAAGDFIAQSGNMFSASSFNNGVQVMSGTPGGRNVNRSWKYSRDNGRDVVSVTSIRTTLSPGFEADPPLEHVPRAS